MKKILYTFSFVGAMMFAGNALAQTPGNVTTGNKAAVKNATVAPAATAAPAAEEVPKTKIGFPEVQWDFGTIKQGDVVKHDFVFTNEGENDLILKDVKPTCGCTALDWPKTPIKPGESAIIVTQFNSRGKMGQQYKYFTIRYNGEPEVERVSFKGNVVPPAPKEEPKSAPAPGTATK